LPKPSAYTKFGRPAGAHFGAHTAVTYRNLAAPTVANSVLQGVDR